MRVKEWGSEAGEVNIIFYNARARVCVCVCVCVYVCVQTNPDKTIVDWLFPPESPLLVEDQ